MPARRTPDPSDPSGALPAATRARFRDGDGDALGAVFDRYHRAVWAVALRTTRSEPLAQEVVQEAFVRAWRSCATYDTTRDLGSWLLGITRHTALDVLRRELRPTRGGHEAERDVVVEPESFDRTWQAWAVQEALGQLADHEREIVRLSFYEDLTHAQIAERLDLPVGTVKSRSHRAHRRLATLLAHLRDGENRRDPGRRTAVVTGPAEPKESSR